ncbi:hypothetical protein ES702_02677 [subsurface metagenome]
MKKAVVIAVAVSLLLGLVGSAAVAQSDRAIARKYDLEGSFFGLGTYNWPGAEPGALWNYSIHIKEALDGGYSVGSIHFFTGNISVVGIVKATKFDYDYWVSCCALTPNLAAVGTANYEGTTYYFMFIYAADTMWFALNDVSYEDPWAADSVWMSGRDYELHSGIGGASAPWDPKVIHAE